MAKKTIILEQPELLAFCGPRDQRIRQIQEGLPADILARGNEIVISGEDGDVENSARIIQDLLHVQRQSGATLTGQQIQAALRDLHEPEAETAAPLAEVFLDRIPLPGRGKQLSPYTRGQKKYIDSMRRSDIVFAIGPAGTGKTYLAVAMAVWHLAENLVRRIILARPAVEAGERLGFLPGDIAAKFDPFVRPLYDALYDMMEPEKVKAYLDSGIIEIAPLAFMRGRTLNDAFVILDEGQNTTTAQMKMFLTRLGVASKAVVTGDITQVDLPAGTLSGLIHAEKVLKSVHGIKFHHFRKEDVVRHDLVQRVVDAYEKHGARRR